MADGYDPNESLPEETYGITVPRTMFEDLVVGIRNDYAVNKRKSSRRLNNFVVHLSASFSRMRVVSITTDRVKGYIAKRQQQRAANGTINHELGCLKRMFRLPTRKHRPAS